jgi:hypothetical protein
MPHSDRSRARCATIAMVLANLALAFPAFAQDTTTTRTPNDTTVVLSLTESTAGPIVFRSGGATAAGQAIVRATSGPHAVLDGRGEPVALTRRMRSPGSVVVIAPRVTVAARVQGDVVVVGGDLFMHPGGRIEKDAVAIGGGVYNSTLAQVGGTRRSLRDETFEVSRESGQLVLTHRVTRVEGGGGAITWPFRVGLRLPSYNRIDGAVVPWGPLISLAQGAISVDPTVTYRSDLGAFDPRVRTSVAFGALEAVLDLRRATFSNDKWIRGDFVNSLTTLFAGRDTRNYYRADRADLTVATRWRLGGLTLEPFIGAVNEFGWSSGAELSADSHPWSLFGKDSVNGIYRPNPSVKRAEVFRPPVPALAADRGRIESGIVGAKADWSPEDVQVHVSASYERAWDAPTREKFGQLTLDGDVRFPTFGEQRLELRSHAVLSSERAEEPPLQRWVYLGGGGTIPTMDLLEQGGTELFFFEGNYLIPIPWIQLPIIGAPILTLRYMTGSAGIADLPKFTQNVGARLGMRFIGIEYVIDPESKEKEFGIGFSLRF